MLEICKMLTLSTAHLMVSTQNELAVMCNPCDEYIYHQFSVYPKEGFGWFIYPAVNKFQFKEEQMSSLPEDLISSFSLARDLGIDILCFDCDAEAVGYLPQFEEE